MIPRRALATASLLTLLATPASAGRQTGSISGTVTESSGSGLRGALVTLIGATGSTPATTGKSGDFRLEGLTPGRYDLKVELDGFQPRRVDHVIVAIAGDVAIDFVLTVAGPAETVEVVDEAPPILPATSSVDNSLTQDLLFNMPFPRNFGDLQLHAPGIVDRALGSPTSAVLQDGVETRNPEAGELWLLLSYNWVDEVQFAGLGAGAEYGGYTGAVLNSVTRSGGNRLSGLFDVLYGPESLVSDNLTGTLVRRNPELEGRALPSDLFDVGAQLGGPIVEDELFFFAGVERRLTESTSALAAVPERVVTPKAFGKLTYVASPRDQFVGILEFDDFNLMTLAPSPELSTLGDGPEIVWNTSWRHTFGARTFAEIKYTGFTSYFDQFPAVDEPKHFEVTTGEVSGSSGSFDYRSIGRHQWNASLSRYAEAFGRHDLKFGLEVERSRVASRYGYVGGVFYYDYYGVPYQAYSYDVETSARNEREALYVQDSWKPTARLTVDAGLRLDWIRGTNPERGTVYDVVNVQPRIGFSLDPGGSGRWLLKAHWGRYHEGALTGIFRRALPGIEGGIGYSLAPDGTVGPVAFRNPFRIATVDPDIGHPYMEEMIAGLDAALPLSLRLSVTGIWRDNHNVVGQVEPGTRYVPITFTNALTGEEVSTYAPRAPMTESPLLANPAAFQYLDEHGNVVGTPKPFFNYRGLMIVCRRPYLDRWQAQLSYVWSRATGTVESNLSNLDYYAFLQRFEFRPHALTNLEGELARSRRHEIKAMVSYEVPKVDVAFNAYLRSMSGGRYSVLQEQELPDGLVAFLEPRGSRERPWSTTLDLRIEKIMRRGGDRFGLFADITNVFNASTVTEVEAIADDPDRFEAPLEIVDPRRIILGARWSF